MYSETSISVLKNRIGWSDVLPSGFPIVLSNENKTKESGRTFDNFHSLVTAENVYCAVPEVQTTEGKFNAYLLDVKEQAVRQVLTRIMNQNELYVDSFNYDNTIAEKRHLFDEPIGYSVACQMIELFISTTRSNFVERNAKFAYQNLKIELEGAKNERGYTVAVGIRQKLEKSIKTATDMIFPSPIIIQNANVW